MSFLSVQRSEYVLLDGQNLSIIGDIFSESLVLVGMYFQEYELRSAKFHYIVDFVLMKRLQFNPRQPTYMAYGEYVREIKKSLSRKDGYITLP